MSICTSSPHPTKSTSYHPLAVSMSGAGPTASLGPFSAILFSPFFGNADAARPLPTSCAAHTRCYHTNTLHTTSDEGVVDPRSRGCPRRGRQRAAIPPWSRRARKRWIFYDSDKDQQKYSSHHGRMRVPGDGACRVGIQTRRWSPQVLLGHEGCREPTHSFGGPLLPSQGPVTRDMA